jgi:translation elongation factor EF-1alpha
MEMFHEPITAAFPGDNIGILIKGVIYTEIKRGEVIGNVSWCPPKKLS